MVLFQILALRRSLDDVSHALATFRQDPNALLVLHVCLVGLSDINGIFRRSTYDRNLQQFAERVESGLSGLEGHETFQDGDGLDGHVDCRLSFRAFSRHLLSLSTIGRAGDSQPRRKTKRRRHKTGDDGEREGRGV